LNFSSNFWDSDSSPRIKAAPAIASTVVSLLIFEKLTGFPANNGGSFLDVPTKFVWKTFSAKAQEQSIPVIELKEDF